MRLFATLCVLLPLIASSFATVIVAREDASVALEARQSYGDCIRWRYRKQERWAGTIALGLDPESNRIQASWSTTSHIGTDLATFTGSLGMGRQLYLTNRGPPNHKYRINFALPNGGGETFWLNSGERCTITVGFHPSDVRGVTFQDKTG